MASYGILSELRARLDITSTTDTADDARLGMALEAASLAIERLTGRRFYATTETRYFTTRDPLSVRVDDLLSVTTLSTDHDGDRVYEYTWAVTDYDLTPTNAALAGGPYTRIEVAPAGNYVFPVGEHNPKAIKVVGSFGYCTAANCPMAVHEACYLMAAQLFKRKDALFGVQGSAGFYQTLKATGADDPTVMLLLRPYMRRLW